MRRPHITSLAVCLFTLALGSTARGQNPCPGAVGTASTVPCVVTLVGTASGVPDLAGLYTVQLINTQGRPMADVEVKLVISDDYTDPYSDYRISSDQPFTDMQTHCFGLGHHIFTSVTNAQGVAQFLILGASVNSSCSDAGNDQVGAHIYACGQELQFCSYAGQFGIYVATPDLDGGGGIGPADFSLWQSDFYCGTYHARSDFDGNGVLTPADYSILLSLFFAGGSANSAPPPYCP